MIGLGSALAKAERVLWVRDRIRNLIRADIHRRTPLLFVIRSDYNNTVYTTFMGIQNTIDEVEVAIIRTARSLDE